MKIETSYNNLKIGVEHGQMVARECSHCHEWKPASEFYKSDSGAYGRYCRCKVCYNLRQKQNEDACKDRRGSRNPNSISNLQRKYDQLYEAYENVCKENYRISSKLKALQEILK